MASAPIPRRLHFVVGKGGVGKSSVAAALALAAAGPGRRILAVEVGRPDGLARALAVAPGAAGRFQAVAGTPGLTYAWLEGAAALVTYLSDLLPTAWLLRALTHSRAYRYFVAAAPGLKELMVIGQVRHEYRRQEGGAPAWDAVVIDAGASARGLGVLGMPEVAARTFATGLVHREAEDVLSYLRDPVRSRVHVVALPEELPLTEATEIVGRLRDDLRLPLGEVVVNRCRPASPAGTGAAVAALASAAPAVDAAAGGVPAAVILAGAVVAARRALGWEAVQAEGLSRFEAETGLAPRRLPRLRAADPPEVARGLVAAVAPLLGDGATP